MKRYVTNAARKTLLLLKFVEMKYILVNALIDSQEFNDYTEITEWSNNIVGKSHTFDDGKKLEVFQVKQRDSGPWITYFTHDGPGVPKKLVIHAEEFREHFGHLFGDEYFDGEL